MNAKITIQLSKGSIFYTLTKSLSAVETNIPSCLTEFRSDVYWKIEILKYHSDKRIEARVIDYRAKMLDFASQVNNRFEISNISFTNLNFQEVINAISSNAADSLAIVKNQIQVKVPLVNLNYNDGYVDFETDIDQHPIYIKVKNVFIKKEFEPISNYISKFIGSQKANFLVDILKIVDRHCRTLTIQVEKAISPQIDKINSSIIEDATCDYSFDLILEDHRLNNPHDLRTPDAFLKEVLGENQDITPEVFLEKAFKFKGGRHRNQLKYLSSKHLADILSLHFTPDPFSFLFLIPGSEKFFLVLETFDAELATYIWECESDPSSALTKLEEIKPLMSAFADKNRRKYVSSKPLGFYRIIHDNKNDIDGYNAWREKFDAIVYT